MAVVQMGINVVFGFVYGGYQKVNLFVFEILLKKESAYQIVLLEIHAWKRSAYACSGRDDECNQDYQVQFL